MVALVAALAYFTLPRLLLQLDEDPHWANAQDIVSTRNFVFVSAL